MQFVDIAAIAGSVVIYGTFAIIASRRLVYGRKRTVLATSVSPER
jgi:hypothetical protein